MKVLNKILFLSLSLLLCSPIWGQITTYTTTNKQKIVVGDQLDIVITVDRDEEVTINQVSIESIEQFDFVKILDFSEGVDSIRSGGISRIYRLSIALYDEGLISLPGMGFQYQLKDSEMEIFSDSIRVEVRLLPDSKDIQPIKDIIKQEVRWYDNLPLLWMGVIAVLIGLAIWFFKRKRKITPTISEEVPVVLPSRPAHEIALEELNELKEKRLWQDDKIIEYQSELTGIIRSYVKRKFGVNAPEMPTTDTLNGLKSLVSPAQLKTLEDVLNVADMIKFAKHLPEQSIHELFYDKAKDFVIQTTKQNPEL